LRFAASHIFEIAVDAAELLRQLDFKPPENRVDRLRSENVTLKFFEQLRRKNVGRDSWSI
jgi:hypothetical protein